jgi:uncharacterized protein
MSQADATDPHVICDLETLATLYGSPSERAIAKELEHISPHYQRLIEHAPFVVIASVGPEGMDCSPRGDAPGFVQVANPHTVLMPDRRGNNRTDTLRNIIRDPRVALLFLIPGIGETLRINGRAEITTKPSLLEQFAIDGKLPRSVIRITAERVYFQCSKALARSKLWDPSVRVERKQLPTPGQILGAIDETFDAVDYDRKYPQHMHETMY